MFLILFSTALRFSAVGAAAFTAATSRSCAFIQARAIKPAARIRRAALYQIMAGPAEKIKIPRNFRLLDEFDHRCAARSMQRERVPHRRHVSAVAIAMHRAAWG
jgi:hypothetical protein